jgi:hypothetical protein
MNQSSVLLKPCISELASTLLTQICSFLTSRVLSLQARSIFQLVSIRGAVLLACWRCGITDSHHKNEELQRATAASSSTDYTFIMSYSGADRIDGTYSLLSSEQMLI